MHAGPMRTARGRPLSILVVGNAAAEQDAIAAMLTQAGHMAATADDGDGMLDALDIGEFDALVLVPTAPTALAGAKLHRFLSLDRPPLTTIALIPAAAPEIKRACADAGVHCCLATPLERHRLLDVLCELAASEQAQAAVIADHAPVRRRRRPAIDTQALDALATLGGMEFACAQVAQFLDETPAVLDALVEAIAAGDMAMADMQLYRLRNDAANVGARAISHVCGSWHQLTPANAMCPPIERLRRELARLRGVLQGRSRACKYAATGNQPASKRCTQTGCA